jgi:hypothetical protein
MQSLIAIKKRRYEMKKILMILMMLLILIAFVGTKQVYAAAALADEGALLILDTVFSDQAKDTSVKLALFCTDVTPTDSTTYVSYTWCAGGVGETPKTLTVGAGWTPSGAAPPQVAYAQQDFSFTGDLTTNVTIYGYCLTDSAATKTYGCETLTSPFTPHNGYHLYITPILKLSTGSPS